MNNDVSMLLLTISTLIYKSVKAIKDAVFYKGLWLLSKYCAWKERRMMRTEKGREKLEQIRRSL